MTYRIKYRLIRNILSDYLSFDELDINVVNINTVLTIDINDEYNCVLSINSDDAVEFTADKFFVEKLQMFEIKYKIAKVVEYLEPGDSFLIFDEDSEVNVKLVDGFGSHIVLIGNIDYVISVPVSEDFNDEDIDDIVLGFGRYEKCSGFPDASLKIKLPENIFSRLSIEMFQTNLFV